MEVSYLTETNSFLSVPGKHEKKVSSDSSFSEMLGKIRRDSSSRPDETQSLDEFAIKEDLQELSEFIRKLHGDSSLFMSEAQPSGELINKEELQELLDFLKNENMPEIAALLETLQSLLSFASTDLQAFLRGNFFKNDNGFVAPGDLYKLDKTVSGVIREIGTDGVLQGKKQEFSYLAKGMEKALEQDLITLLKAVKQFELAGNKQSFAPGEGGLRELAEQLTEKLKILQKSGQQLNPNLKGKEALKLAYLQQTFSAALQSGRGIGGRVNVQMMRDYEQTQLQTKILPSNPFIQFQWSTAEQLAFNSNTSGKETTSADLLKQFDNIIAKSHFTNLGGTQKLNIKLIPEHLGRLSIELVQKDGALVAKLLTTTGLAKETLESQLHTLKQAFSQQNIPIEKIEIAQQLNESQEKFFDMERESQEQQQNKEQENVFDKNNGEEKDGDFTNNLEEALLYMEV